MQMKTHVIYIKNTEQTQAIYMLAEFNKILVITSAMP